jgi:hypothetical protein
MPPAGLKLLYPLKPATYPITQHFGENPQWYPLTHGHNGIDFGVPLRTPVYATLPGRVVRVANDNSGYGNHVRISHANNLLSLYGHFDESNWHTVQEGDEVEAGKQIGFSGNTGHSTGPHLHFEVREGSKAFDPEPYLTTSLGPIPIPDDDTPIFKVRVKDTTLPFLNVRTGPSIVYPIINSYAPNEEMDAFEISGAEIWLRTKKGFVALRYNGNDLVEIVK